MQVILNLNQKRILNSHSGYKTITISNSKIMWLFFLKSDQYTSEPVKKYKKILTSDDTKINNVAIKRHNGKYYAVFNVKTSIMMFDKTFESVGVDLGLRTLATLSNELEKANIDVTYEDEMIHKYQRKLARKKPGSKRYKNTLQTYWKWVDKKTNKIKHAQHQISHDLAKYYDIICMENLDVKGMFENKNISSILQSTGLASLVEKIKYKCEWHDKEFIQISRWFPSSKKCHNCGYIHHNLKDEKTWNCPKCGKHHDRDINASKNILQEGTRIFREKIMNLWCRGGIAR